MPDMVQDIKKQMIGKIFLYSMLDTIELNA